MIHNLTTLRVRIPSLLIVTRRAHDLQEDAGGGRRGGGGEISFVNQKRPGRGGAHPGFSSTIGLLKGRLAMLHGCTLHREAEDLGLCWGVAPAL